ncbi:hypothetical protein E4U10_005274 [Claviceps purpurea]|nr:hypothetical protein E4U10_005274 [Claviceps purpurea]
MEPASGKLTDVAPMPKDYPVANYSYPRNRHTRTSCRASCRSSSQCSSSTSQSPGRGSLGSDASAPGLIEDRADSEVSCDDDDQYLTHMAQVWDTFWRPSPSSKRAESIAVPSRQLPALIPVPHRKQQSLEHRRQHAPAWPLPCGSSPSPQKQPRKATVSYSAFPKPDGPHPISRLPAVANRMASASQQTRPHSSHKSDSTPPRPPRPAETMITPYMQPSSLVPTSFIRPDYTIPENDDLSSVATTTRCRPAAPGDDSIRESWDKASHSRPSTSSIYSVVSQSAAHLPSSPIPEIRPSLSRAPRHPRSINTLPPCYFEQEPKSVFEYDSDDEEENCHGRSFFALCKRSCVGEPSRWRNRGRTATPTSAHEEAYSPPSSPQKRHGRVIFGRFLGRRSQ